MQLGNILKELIEQYDITQKELAKALTITPSALGNYVQGTREPDYRTLIRIADYFHVTTDYLLDHKIKGGITRQEEQLLNIFRSLSQEQKEFYLEQGKLFISMNNKKTLSHSDRQSEKRKTPSAS